MVMRAVYFCLIVLFFTAMPVFAQDQPPSTDQIVSMMQSKLNLTQDQVTAVTPIIEKYSSKREALRQSMEDGTADRDSIRAQMKELKTGEGQELSQVLSADQMSQWSSMQSQGRHKHNSDSGGTSGSGGGGGEGGGD